MTEQMRFLSGKFLGWNRVWECIRVKYGGTECLDDATGETWQYMGSTDKEHQFRHRALNGVRATECIPVEDGDFDVDFDVYNFTYYVK